MAAAETGIGRRTALIFAASSGVAVANVYYLQPVLAVIAADMHASLRAVGNIAFAQQVGYAAGILLFVPLGDIVQRRTLIVLLFALASVALGAAAFAPNVASLAAALCVVGIATSVPQVLQPFAADLAAPGERARALGHIITGVIVGMVGARVISGMLGAYLGWRSVFGFAAAFTAISTFALARAVPLRAPASALHYRDILASMPGLLRSSSVLRVSMALGALMYAVFTGFWTVLAFHVKELGYGSEVVGYLSLVAVVGALVASSIGRMTDRFGTIFTGTFGWLCGVTAFTVFIVFGNYLAGVFAGMAVFALATQSTQVGNQTRIFAIGEGARSRLNTIYMFAMYVGGAWGSFVCAWAYPSVGWTGTCLICLGHLALMGAALVWLRDVQQRAPAIA